jgi:hypothetical protein
MRLAQPSLLRPTRRPALLLGPLLVLGAVGCAARDPKKELAIDGLETYWAIARTTGDTHYLAPVARFELRATGEGPLRSAQANAIFRREGETQEWGAAFQQVVVPRKPLAPGEKVLVVLVSDTHYFTNGAPEGIFGHEEFKDAHVELFLRVGSSAWVKLAEAPVERRIGTRSVQDLVR